MTLKVSGGAELRLMAAQLKLASPVLRRELTKTLRRQMLVAQQAVQGAVRPVSPLVAGTVRVSATPAGKRVQARIFTDPSRMPTGHEALPALLELGSKGSGGRYIRHPVFGSRAAWANQPTHPYFYGTLDSLAPRVRAGALMAARTVARSAGFR